MFGPRGFGYCVLCTARCGIRPYMADADGSASELGSLGAAALVSAAEGAWHANRSGRVRCTGNGGINGGARLRGAGAGWAVGGVGDELVGESAAELVRIYDHLSRRAKS